MSNGIEEVLRDLQAEGDGIDAVLDGLDTDGWELASGAPGWAIADVVLHLARTEEGVVATPARGARWWTEREGHTMRESLLPQYRSRSRRL
jgi:hypothetical protein